LVNTSAISAEFNGEKNNTYAFYATATNHVGTQETYVPVSEAETIAASYTISTSENENQAATRTLISSLLNGHYSDAGGKLDTNGGIGLVGLNGNGTWQYSSNGITWTTISNVSQSRALLLPQSYSLRFEPAQNSSGQGQAAFFAWNGSRGTAR